MNTADATQFSDELKIAMLNTESKLFIEHRSRAENTRRNHIISVFVALFFSLTGLYPSKIDAFGIEIDRFPAVPFYIFLSLLVLYMYWSYQTHLKTATLSWQTFAYMYTDVICFDYRELTDRFISNSETFVYKTWQRYVPIFISIFAILSCVSRAVYEAVSVIPS